MWNLIVPSVNRLFLITFSERPGLPQKSSAFPYLIFPKTNLQIAFIIQEAYIAII